MSRRRKLLGRVARRLEHILEGGEEARPAPPRAPVAAEAVAPPQPPAVPPEMSAPVGPFHVQLTIAEVLALHPGAADVLAGHGARGCPSCALRHTEPLGEGLSHYGIDPVAVVDDLNQLSMETAAP